MDFKNRRTAATAIMGFKAALNPFRKACSPGRKMSLKKNINRQTAIAAPAKCENVESMGEFAFRCDEFRFAHEFQSH